MGEVSGKHFQAGRRLDTPQGLMRAINWESEKNGLHFGCVKSRGGAEEKVGGVRRGRRD